LLLHKQAFVGLWTKIFSVFILWSV